jgi:acyl-CoA dehydrogenase
MEFRLSDEERAFQEAVRRFGDRVLRPHERAIDKEGRIPAEVLSAMAELGLLAMPVPEEYGGMGASAVLTELAAEEVGRGDFSMATAVFFLLEAGWGGLLARHGTEELKRSLLPQVTSGKAFLGIATTESTGGSDLGAMRTTSERQGSEFVVRGEKVFVSGVEEAKALGGGHLTLTKSTSGGFTFLYVPTRSENLSTQRFENMGRMGISTGGLTYQGVRVPASSLVGLEGKGFELAMEGFTNARTFVSAACVGAAERALEAGIQHLRGREVFGRALGKFEGPQFELVDLWTQVDAVKWQCRRAAWLLDQARAAPASVDRGEVERAVAAVKLTAPQVAFECVKRVMMWHGASGYTKDAGLELGFRGIMSYLVGAEGGLNVMRMILGRELLGREFLPYR